jgi:hypothetical protein
MRPIRNTNIIFNHSLFLRYDVLVDYIGNSENRLYKRLRAFIQVILQSWMSSIQYYYIFNTKIVHNVSIYRENKINYNTYYIFKIKGKQIYIYLLIYFMYKNCNSICKKKKVRRLIHKSIILSTLFLLKYSMILWIVNFYSIQLVFSFDIGNFILIFLFCKYLDFNL